jgi:molecular chaperone IbpA
MTNTALPSIFNNQLFLGFNNQFDRWSYLQKQSAAFPPYNLIKDDENSYRVELAIAGYSKEDLSISVEKDVLTISSSKEEDTNENEKTLHRGIAKRSWTRTFVLGEYMIVKNASMKDGMLTVSIEREIPEELKPKFIEIE